MLTVECHGANGPVSKPSEWDDVPIACSFVKLMWEHTWVTHFVVTGPDWKVIIRRRQP